jgi:hypothetical protein
MATRADGERETQELIAFNPGSETYSSRVLRILAKNPLFQPKIGKDGKPSPKEMLTVASTLLSAADERIASLEKRASVLNAPMFQRPMLSGGNAEIATEDKETSWLMKYFTLRNFAGVVIVLVGGLWTVFTWWTADRSVQLQHAQSELAESENSRQQFQKDAEYYKKDREDLKNQVDKELKEAQDRVSEAEKESSNLKGRVQELEKQVKATQAAGASGPPSSSTSH